jgi:hypothetical protein
LPRIHAARGKRERAAAVAAAPLTFPTDWPTAAAATTSSLPPHSASCRTCRTNS